MRIAVLTDAISDQHFFPIWRSYYGGLFGEANLFVVTYAGGSKFNDETLGGVIRLPVGYDDATRASVMSDMVAALLGAYDVVVRVDADEILVVDPAAAPSLRAYIEGTNRPYYTARGFDVVQTLEEAALRPGKLLAQRRFAYPASALNKTAITRVPMHWSQGFHWCSAFPEFGPLFMLHLKRIDIEWQMQWFAQMTGNISGNPKVQQIFKDYYNPDREKILAYHRGASARPRLSGMVEWYREEHQRRFIEGITYHAKDDFYSGSYAQDMVLCEVPEAWKQLL